MKTQMFTIEHETAIYSGERLIANCGGYADSGNPNILEENKTNAFLIRALLSAAHSLNPTDPLAAAQHLEALVKEFAHLCTTIDKSPIVDWQELRNCLHRVTGK